ncbi:MULTISPECIES: phosphotransferase family protein [Gordonia]|jgi:aminoglycoside phosphotransferase (APT) family kinase protein|uniref:Putative phosphotransferase n=1 Tax=Gordonia alkanivorans NBRC 16433 TaxID=1027371 RepID=F9VPM6_9ACTN|nr:MULTISPECIES: phosphotransferase family protein [Gordonia]MDH3008424.1 phosphotransferase family protein [Gordonia alkanivorans]MDH3015646.1 phosphotransferase family protein [Gordonia alkanivorans]MDH3020380.1 phosphotransferase family protein [Gordonia alkanivorans]MDH3026662.1 phosphotransferase family protein [Gordonia alkanivorans]MDH3040206.1 phosphotransferase family protein [Gordonia alkanivorans]
MTGLRPGLLELLDGTGFTDADDPVRLGGGSSQENWAFEAIAADGRRRPLLLRRAPQSGVVDTERDVEYDLLRRLAGTGLPVAAVHALDPDGSLMGRPAMVVDRLVGRADRAVLRDRDPLRLGSSGRLALAEALADLLGRVHRLDPVALGIPGILESPDDPGRTELDRWEAELDGVELGPHPALRETIAWLRAHLPAPSPIRLVHGDFRPANVLIHGCAISGLLDWELAHLGDPHDDLGWYTCSVYRNEHFVDDRWGLDDFLQRWSQTSGLEVDRERLHFWQVMTALRLAVIALTGVKAFCDGATDRPAGPTRRIELIALRETGLLDGSGHRSGGRS